MPERLASSARAAVGSRWWYPALGAVLVCASLIDAALLSHPPSAVSIALALALCVAVGFCGRAPVAAPLAIAALYAGLALPGLSDAAPDVSVVSPAIAAYAVAAHASRPTALAALVIITASLELAMIASGTWVPELFVSLAPWMVGAIVRSRQRIVAQLEQRTVELEGERETFARLAAQRERARIARELHDIISHNMAVMVVQAGAGRIAPPEDPDQVADIFRRIRAAGSAALVEMDQLVDVLGLHTHSSVAPNTLAGVAELIARARSAGLDITAELSVKDSEVPIEVEQAAYRAIQEGLTNVLKHAPASHVLLRLRAREKQLELEVRNTGSPGNSADLVATGSGLGLAGMNERIRARGGELCAGPLPHGGWRFIVRLPADPVG
jgi:signal transduction histidine kinase